MFAALPPCPCPPPLPLQVMLCADEDTNGGERQGSALLPASPVLEPTPVVPPPYFGRQNSRFHSHPNPFHSHPNPFQGHPQRRTPGYPESASVMIGRSRILKGKFGETSGLRQFQDAASTTSKTFLRGGDSSGHRRSLQGPFSSGHEVVSVGVASEVGSCDPFDGGDDWCAEAVSPTELRALDIEGTTVYCSRECQSQEGQGGDRVASLGLPHVQVSSFVFAVLASLLAGPDDKLLR